MNNISWSDFLAMTEEQQVIYINDLLNSNKDFTISYISESLFNKPRPVISRHFRRLGYILKDRVYVKDFSESNQNITEEKQNITDIKENDIKVNKSNQNDTLKMYSMINDILINMDSKEFERSTVKMTKETAASLDSFLKKHKILNKQDVISVAVELFLNKYNTIEIF